MVLIVLRKTQKGNSTEAVDVVNFCLRIVDTPGVKNGWKSGKGGEDLEMNIHVYRRAI